MSFFVELKRRNVMRVGTGYLVTSWLLVQVAATVFPLFGLDETPSRIVIIVLAIGFVPTLIFSWVFELTHEGVKRDHEVNHTQSIIAETGKRLDKMIIVVLGLALGFFALDRFVLLPQKQVVEQQLQAEEVASARRQGREEAMVREYGEKSIAVLPFADMSPESDQEYFSEGLSEELLNLLARIPELRVISRSSAFSFKGQHLEIPEIAKRLKVAHILEGSVRKAGNQIRITAQLIEARTDTHMWSVTWDRKLDNIFAIQDEISAAVVEQLKVTLLGAGPHTQTTDPRAYALYLRARYLAREGTNENFEQSITLYQQALAITPAYAAAWNGLTGVYLTQSDIGLRTFDEGYELARESANRALAINPNSGQAHANLGHIAIALGDELVYCIVINVTFSQLQKG